MPKLNKIFNHVKNNINYEKNYLLGMILIIILYSFCYGWILISTNYFPYVTDNNESFSVFWHSYNLSNFNFFKSYGLTDDVYSTQEAAHPFAHTHQGNWPRIFGFLIFKLGADTIESQIVVTTLTIGIIGFFSVYHFFAKNINPLFSVIFCTFLMTDYILYAQWHVVTYRVWQLFFLFTTLICIEKLNRGNKSLWIYITVLNYACLFYSELIFAAFVAGMAGLYSINLYWRNIKLLASVIIIQISGAFIGIGILASQLILYYGFSNFKRDFIFTFLSRNHAASSSNLMEQMKTFYGTNNIAFWYNMDDNSTYLSLKMFAQSFFRYDFQVHTPILTLLTLVMAMPIIRILPIYKILDIDYSKKHIKIIYSVFSLISGYLVFYYSYLYYKNINISLFISLFLSSFIILTIYYFKANNIIKWNSEITETCDLFLSYSLFVSFFILALSLTYPNKLEGIEVTSYKIKNIFTINIMLAFAGAVLAFAYINFVTGINLLKQQINIRITLLLIVLLNVCLSMLIKYQHLLYNKGFKILLQNLQSTVFPSSFMSPVIFIASIMSAIILIFQNNNKEIINIMPPLEKISVFLVCGFLSYVVVYMLSAGYLHTGYLTRSTPFTVFITNAILSVGAYLIIRYSYDLIYYSNISNFNMPSIFLFLFPPILILITLSIYWLGLQYRYIQLLPPNHFSFLKELAKEPFKGKNYIVGNYAAPVSAYSGSWAYLSFNIPENLLQTKKGFKLDSSIENTYLWMADRRSNLEYLKPDYYICMSNQNLGTVNAILANQFDGAKNNVGCDSLIKSFTFKKINKNTLDHKLISSDIDEGGRGWASWAIIKLDWEHPPTLTALSKLNKTRPVNIDVQREGNHFSIKYDYEYFQQDNIPEANSIVQLVKIGKNEKCLHDYSDLIIINNAPNINKKFNLPLDFIGKIAIRVQPSNKSKTSSIWYYSPTKSISNDNSLVETCPVNIANEIVSLKIEQINKYINLTSNEIWDADFFEIEMSVDNSSWIKSGVVSGYSLEYQIHDTDSAKKYSFRIRGCNSENRCTHYSNVRSVDAIKLNANDDKY